MSNQTSERKGGLEFKLLLCGEESVGKTSLIQRFVENSFNESATYEGELQSTELTLFGVPIKLYLQDLGKEIWEDVASFYVSDNDGILLVFDTSEKIKMKHSLDYWFQSIRDINQEIPLLLIGNKSDLPVKVNLNKIVQYISKLGINLIQTSAKTGDNVSYAFKLLTSEIVKKKAAEKKRVEGKRTDGLDNIFSRYEL
jgi:small GTP-binding protein